MNILEHSACILIIIMHYLFGTDSLQELSGTYKSQELTRPDGCQMYQQVGAVRRGVLGGAVCRARYGGNNLGIIII